MELSEERRRQARIDASETAICPHNWVSGPFYVMVAVTYEEPDYYPPQGMIPVEHCTLCGLIRLPEAYRQKVGRNLR